MDNKYQLLQELLKKGEIHFRYKRSVDIFAAWLLLKFKTNKLAFLYPLPGIYLFLFSLWLCIPLVIFLGFRFNWFFLGFIAIPFIVKYTLNEVGKGFIMYDAVASENFFNLLWENQIVMLESADKNLLVMPPQDWKEELQKRYKKDGISNLNPDGKTQDILRSFNNGVKQSVEKVPDARTDPAGYTEWALANKLEEMARKNKH